MAKEIAGFIKLQIKGGAANPAPPVAIQLLEAAKVKSGSAQPNRNKVASITAEQCRQIAEDKMVDLNCFTVESAESMVRGTARSMGITVK